MTVHSCGYLVDSNWVWFLRKTGFRLQNVSVHLVIGDIYCLLTNNIKIINIKVRLTNVNKDGQVKVNWKSKIFATQKFVKSTLSVCHKNYARSERTESRRSFGKKDFWLVFYQAFDIIWYSVWLVVHGPCGLSNWLERQTSRSQFWVGHELDISQVVFNQTCILSNSISVSSSLNVSAPPPSTNPHRTFLT